MRHKHNTCPDSRPKQRCKHYTSHPPNSFCLVFFSHFMFIKFLLLFREYKSQYLRQSATRIGSKYKKAVYTLYKNASFTEKLEPKQKKSERGILGPVIRAQIRDVIKVSLLLSTKTENRKTVASPACLLKYVGTCLRHKNEMCEFCSCFSFIKKLCLGLQSNT